MSGWSAVTPSSTSSTGPQIAIWQNAGVDTSSASGPLVGQRVGDRDVVERAHRVVGADRVDAVRVGRGGRGHGRQRLARLDHPHVLGGVDLDRHLEHLARHLGATGVDARLVDREAQREVGARAGPRRGAAPRRATPTSSPDSSSTLTVRALGVVLDRRAGPRRRRPRTGARTSRPATSIGRPPKNCTRANPLAATAVVVEPPPSSSSPHAPSSTAPASAPLPARNRRRDTSEGQVGGHRAEPILRPMTASSQPRRCRWWSTARRSRWPTTARPCSTCCATGSGIARRRTGAARRASAAAARCWWTASLGSRASRPPGASAGAPITTADGIAATDRDRWAAAFCATGASQCGFCTPGIVCRLEGLRAKQPDAEPRRRGAGAARPPVPLHRAGARSSTRGTSCSAATPIPPRDLDAATRAGRPRDGRPAAWSRPASRSARAASATTPRRPTPWSPCPTARAAGPSGDTLAEARARAGKVQGRRTTVDAAPPLDAPARGLGGDAAHQLGGARVPRARRVVVRARRRAAHPAGQRRRLRRQGCTRVGRRGRPRARRRARPAGARAAQPRGRRAPRARSGRPSPAARDAGWPRGAAGRPHARASRRPIASVAPDLVGRGGRRARSADVERPARRRLGGGGRAARRRPRHGGPGHRSASPAPTPRPRSSTAAVRVRVDAGEPARPGRAALVRHRRRPHGAVVAQPRRASRSTTTGTVHDLTIRSFGVLRAVDTPPIEVEIVAEHGRAGARAATRCSPRWPPPRGATSAVPTDWPTGARWR